MLREGDRLGELELLERIGSGGFASVWLARNSQSGSEAAIKILHPKYAVRSGGPGPSASDRFLEEARILSKIHHPGLVRVIDVIEDPARGVFAYVMERLEGHDLFEIAGRMSLSSLVEIFAEVAHTLDDIHGQGIIHRDIKLNNIFVCDLESPDGRDRAVKIIDFGIAKHLEAESLLESTAKGGFVGTAETMAPESLRRLEGEKIELTGAVDQWGLGIAMYHALNGELPFHGTSLFDLMRQIQEAPTPPLVLLRHFGLERCPDALEAIVKRCLEKAPEKRYPTLRAVAVALSTIAPELSRVPRPDLIEDLPTAPPKAAMTLTTRPDAPLLEPTIFFDEAELDPPEEEATRADVPKEAILEEPEIEATRADASKEAILEEPEIEATRADARTDDLGEEDDATRADASWKTIAEGRQAAVVLASDEGVIEPEIDDDPSAATAAGDRPTIPVRVIDQDDEETEGASGMGRPPAARPQSGRITERDLVEPVRRPRPASVTSPAAGIMSAAEHAEPVRGTGPAAAASPAADRMSADQTRAGTFWADATTSRDRPRMPPETMAAGTGVSTPIIDPRPVPLPRVRTVPAVAPHSTVPPGPSPLPRVRTMPPVASLSTVLPGPSPEPAPDPALIARPLSRFIEIERPPAPEPAVSRPTARMRRELPPAVKVGLVLAAVVLAFFVGRFLA